MNEWQRTCLSLCSDELASTQTDLMSNQSPTKSQYNAHDNRHRNNNHNKNRYNTSCHTYDEKINSRAELKSHEISDVVENAFAFLNGRAEIHKDRSFYTCPLSVSLGFA